jgi:hypothetical protein
MLWVMLWVIFDAWCLMLVDGGRSMGDMEDVPLLFLPIFLCVSMKCFVT